MFAEVKSASNRFAFFNFTPISVDPERFALVKFELLKSEFSKFEGHLSKVQSQLKTASTSLESLQGTRTRAIDRKLKDVELIDSKESKDILEISNE